jgi:spore germination protein YaaH
MPLFASFDQRGIHSLLTNEAARKEAIRLMLFYGRAFHFYGWQFDIENINFTDKDAYTSFFKQTAGSLYQYGFAISSAVVKSDQPAPESANPAYHRFLYESWKGAFDTPAIAAASDFISIMTYDQHTAYTPPGPVAGLPWMKRIVAYLLDPVFLLIKYHWVALLFRLQVSHRYQRRPGFYPR